MGSLHRDTKDILYSRFNPLPNTIERVQLKPDFQLGDRLEGFHFDFIQTKCNKMAVGTTRALSNNLFVNHRFTPLLENKGEQNLSLTHGPIFHWWAARPWHKTLGLSLHHFLCLGTRILLLIPTDQ